MLYTIQTHMFVMSSCLSCSLFNEQGMQWKINLEGKIPSSGTVGLDKLIWKPPVGNGAKNRHKITK
jgi:hypothetical protein